MKNIHELLKSIGIEIPADKKEAFDKEMVENYKTINEVDSIRNKLSTTEKDRDAYKEKYDKDMAQRDADLTALKKQLEESGADANKLSTLQENLTKLQGTYDKDKATWQKQLADQQYKFAVERKADTLKFSSKAARKVFVDSLVENPLQVKNDEIIGFDDYVKAYSKEDEGSIILAEANQQNNDAKPKFSSKSGTSGAGDKSETETKSRPVIW